MRGLWVWSEDPKNQRKILRKIREESHLVAILDALSKNKDGLSNAQVDNSFASNSQWRTLWHLRELMALGFIEYKAEFFGDPGKYIITELGRNALQRILGQPVQLKNAPVATATH